MAGLRAALVDLVYPSDAPQRHLRNAAELRRRAYTDDLYAELFPPDSLKNKRFYNFGSGDWRHPYWTNVDYDSAYYGYQSELIDIHWDVTYGQPVAVESNSAELVYCSHTIEHLRDDHVDHMLREARRILKPGGVIRITTPNAALYYWAYKHRDIYFNHHYGSRYPFDSGDHTFSKRRMSIWLVNEVASQLVQGVGEDRRGAKLLEKVEEIDAIFASLPMEEAFAKVCGMVDFELQREAPGQHVNWWTINKLESACKQAGFAHTVSNVVGGSISPVMRNQNYFDLVDPTFSIFVDAIK